MEEKDKINCPKCKNTDVNEFGATGAGATTEKIHPAPKTSRHFKCNVCGEQFTLGK